MFFKQTYSVLISYCKAGFLLFRHYRNKVEKVFSQVCISWATLKHLGRITISVHELRKTSGNMWLLKVETKNRAETVWTIIKAIMGFLSVSHIY